MQKVAVVGYGFMGQMHTNAHAALANSELAVVADCVAEKREKAETDHGITTVEGLEAVLADDSVSIVDICLPTHMHRDATVAALEAGKHVLCEKPMARTPQQAHEMIAAAEASDGHLMVAQCLRFWPEYAKAKEIIASGELGKIETVSCRRVSPSPTWSWENWLLKAELSGSALLDLHVHDIDFIVHLLGKPERVTARGTNREEKGWDHVFALYEYEGAWDLPPGHPFSMSFCIGCEGGSIAYDLAASPTLSLARAGSDALEHPELPKVDAGEGTAGGNISDMGGYYLEIEYFVGCIDRGEIPTRVPLAETALDIEIAFAEIESIGAGTTVDL